MPRYILFLTEKANKNILCLLCSTECPVFKIKVSVPSVINQPKSIYFTINCFRDMFLSEARTRFGDIAKNLPSNAWISWLKAQILYFSLGL